jgi:predicted ABC-type ATPase
MRPNVYIIAGPNGAGKTTFARKFLPSYAHCTNFVNADLIAEGVSPLLPEAVAFRAGRLMLSEIELRARRGEDFGFETTLSGRTQLNVIHDLKQRGYAVHLFFLWVPTVRLALSRIRGRVLTGGHDVPEPTVRRRFERSISNFFQPYRDLADSWTLFDNSGDWPEIIALEEEGRVRIIQNDLYGRLVARYGEVDSR